jgi:hypothetical protein
MKTNGLHLVLLGLFLIAADAQAQDFEGQFVQRVTRVDPNGIYEVLGEAMYADDVDAVAEAIMDLSPDDLMSRDFVEVEDLRVFVKGDVMRVQINTGGEPEGYQLLNSSTGTSWMVNVPEKSYLEFTKQAADEMVQKTKEMMEQMGVDPDQMEEYAEQMTGAGTTESTGRTSNVNGRTATAYRYNDDQTVAIGWCAADDSGFIAAMAKRVTEGAFADAEADREDQAGFECPDGELPARTLTYDRYGESLEIDDLLSIDTGSLPDALFKVPAGFEKKSLTLGNMLGQ